MLERSGKVVTESIKVFLWRRAQGFKQSGIIERGFQKAKRKISTTSNGQVNARTTWHSCVASDLITGVHRYDAGDHFQYSIPRGSAIKLPDSMFRATPTDVSLNFREIVGTSKTQGFGRMLRAAGPRQCSLVVDFSCVAMVPQTLSGISHSAKCLARLAYSGQQRRCARYTEPLMEETRTCHNAHFAVSSIFAQAWIMVYDWIPPNGWR